MLLEVLCLLFCYPIYLLLSTVYQVQRRKRVLKPVPGLKESFILGHGQYFVNQPPATIWKILNESQELGKVVKWFLLTDILVVVSDPKIFEAILSGHKFINKSREYDLVRNWLGDGLLMSAGKKWMKRRKVLTSAFHFNILEEFIEVFDRNSSIFVEIIKSKKSGTAVDICPLVTLAALDIICETSMGRSVDAQRNSGSEYVKAVKDISHILHLRMFDIILRNDFTYKFTATARREQRSLKILHGFTDSVITARRKELLKESEGSLHHEPKAEEVLGRKKRMALLDVLLKSTIDGKPLTNADIREEVDTFMFEGHDTTTSAISFILYSIAKRPEVQKKILKEVHQVIGEEKSSPVTLQKLNDLHYLDSVIKESMRLYPPVPLIGRLIDEDIEINGVKLPAGITVTIGIAFIHRDPVLFPKPEEFIPERFLETAGAVNPYSYVPFSAGPRNCIGQKFAALEMKSMISNVVKNFEISVDPSYKGPELIAEIVLKPQNGIWLNFKER